MTEADWLSLINPDNLIAKAGDRVSDRKLRLVAIACCRAIWPQLSGDVVKCVETAERFADGLATESDLLTARESAQRQLEPQIGRVSMYVVSPIGLDAARATLQATRRAYAHFNMGKQPHIHVRGPEWLLVPPQQVQLIRDIFGNPFRPVTLNAAWLAWNNGTVVKLAQAIYDERAFDRLPILADALEDAGCHHEDILTHCRGPGPHVRGCWVVDLLLGKE